MYPEIPLIPAILLAIVGLAVLAWSANLFVDAAATIARALGVSPFVIGMVIIGFGTSAPELCVSALSGITGHSNLSLGNAYGSCIFNIACILGVAAVIRPLAVKPAIVYAAAPMLVAISVVSCLHVGMGGGFSRLDGVVELLLFLVLMPLYCWFDQCTKGVAAVEGCVEDVQRPRGGMARAWAMLATGLALLVGSSHVLVWGCVVVARKCGVSELLIGLTVVAMGTSLPELASAVASARKGQNEFVLGNIVGSNLFNTLAVVGLAGTISPFRDTSAYVLYRDMPVLVALSASIVLFGFNWRHPRQGGSITRMKGVLWLLAFLAYYAVMMFQELRPAG